MPPHCDSLDGPVVTAAKAALADENLELILPFVPESAEEEVRVAFERTRAAQAEGGDIERVRVHRSPGSSLPAWTWGRLSRSRSKQSRSDRSTISMPSCPRNSSGSCSRVSTESARSATR